MASETALSEVFPEELWDHDLFQNSATFRQPTTQLLADRLDVRLRVLRNQPSSADATPASILAGLNQLHGQARKWIEPTRKGNRPPAAHVLQRLDRLRNMLAAPLSEELLQRSLKSVMALLPPDLQTRAPQPGLTRQETADRLGLISILLLEQLIQQDPALYRRYVKRLYIAMDRALSFNATTDTVRLTPVLRWIKESLNRQRRVGCAYADIGCAAAAGAPGLLAAAAILRSGGPCSQLHGIDITEPSRRVSFELARQGILIYASDPVTRPLPRRYDVMLLANVHRHLTRPLQARLFRHLCRSLNEYGLLFINWRFSDSRSPCLALEKRRGQLWLEAERNCV